MTELYLRHHSAVLALSWRLCRDPQAAEDLANEAFTRTLRTVRTGSGGPSEEWRPYLYAVARNTAAEWARDNDRLVLIADEQYLEPDLSAAAPEPPDELVARAFRALPERQQRVLWHTLVEDEPPDRVAVRLGVAREHVNVLAHRAREGLRTACLAAHVETGSPDCREFADQLAVAVRNPKRRVPRALREYLGSCESCARAHGELRDLNTTLRASLPLGALPLVWDKGTPAAAPGSTGFFSGLPHWAVPAAVVAALLIGPSEETWSPPVAAPTRSPAASVPPLSPTASVPPQSPTASVTPTPRPSLAAPPVTSTTRAAVAGTRIVTVAGDCVGETGGKVPGADPGTAWSRNDVDDGFELVNVLSGRCLSAGEQYDTEAFNGTGMRAVRLTTCDRADDQRWRMFLCSDGFLRLVSAPTGAALSVGEEITGKPAPTAFILYAPPRVTVSSRTASWQAGGQLAVGCGSAVWCLLVRLV